MINIDINFMRDIFKKSVELDDTYDLSLHSMFEEVPGWDSIGHMQIIGSIEEDLDIEFEIEEIVGINTVQKLIDLAKSKL
tara:strand:- start:310 stop:549 length:240 start_codon:yes stop_codon:yes gene_type:complete